MTSAGNNTLGARISLPDAGPMTDAQKRVFDMIVSGKRGELVGPLRAALHNPTLAESWSNFGEILRYRTSLSPKLSELAVMVTARHWNSELEWSVHRRAAEAAGLSPVVLDSIRDGVVPELDAEEAEIYQFTSSLLKGGNVEDDVYQKVLQRWGELGVVELTALIGYYCMVALTLNVHRIPLPASYPADLLKGQPQPDEITPVDIATSAKNTIC